MINTKIIVLGALCAALAAIFQLIPFFLTEILIFLTIFSSLPIYIVSRINPKVGVLTYIVASFIIMILSIHEGLFFLCTNGIIGISLGICQHYKTIKSITWLICSIVLTITLSIMNYGIGVPVFGSELPGTIIIQLGIIFLVSIFYNIFYYYFSTLNYNYLKKHLSLIE